MSLSQAQVSEIARLHSIKHRSHEKKAVKLISSVFAQQSKKLSTFVGVHGIAVGTSFIDKIITPEALKLALKRIWLAVGSDYANLHTMIKKSEGPTLHQSYMMAYADSLQAASKVTAINDETRARLRETLKQAAEDKLHKRDVAKRIAESTGFSSKRSLLIARTETTLAANRGAFGAAKETGLNLKKYWIATEDDRTREAHADMDSSEGIPMDEAFEVDGEKMMYPGDPSGSAANVCNCRCVVAFRPNTDQSESDSEETQTHPQPSGSIQEEDTSIRDALIALINLISAGETAGEE